MLVVTIYAKQIDLWPVPEADSLSMNSDSPIAVNRPMALAAQARRFFKWNRRAIDKAQNVPILGVVAIKAPSIFRIPVVQNYIIVGRADSTNSFIRFHAGMAIGARENSL